MPRGPTDRRGGTQTIDGQFFREGSLLAIDGASNLAGACELAFHASKD